MGNKFIIASSIESLVNVYKKNSDLQLYDFVLHQHSAYQKKYRKSTVSRVFVDDYSTPGKLVVEGDIPWSLA